MSMLKYDQEWEHHALHANTSLLYAKLLTQIVKQAMIAYLQ